MEKIKYLKVVIDLTVWHLKPFKFNEKVSENNLTIFGFMCFKLIVTWK